MAVGSIKTCWWDHVALIEHMNAVLYRLIFFYSISEHRCADDVDKNFLNNQHQKHM